jgi:hypothetical protein
MALLPSIQPGEIPVRINFDFFFDRAGVASGISKAKRAGLYKAGSVVMQIARRSIQRKGMARPKLAVMKKHPKMPLSVIVDAYGRSSKISRMIIADKIQQRINEIKSRYPSPANSPPFTHTGALRNSITYAYDPGSESVVIGGFMPGIARIVSLHEHGGTQTMQAWAWIPRKTDRRAAGIIGWWAVGRKPRLRRGRWEQMGPQWIRDFTYPKRPYMAPALMEGIKRGRIPKGFGNSVNMSGRPGG